MPFILKTLISISILFPSICSTVALANKTGISQDNQLMIHQMLCKVFDTTINEAQIEPLQEGFSGDKLFLISYDGRKIVVRIHRKNKRGQEKKLEYEASKNAFDLEIGPKVLYVSKNYDLLATQYIEAKHPDLTSFHHKSTMDSLIEGLIKLHTGPKLPRDWSVFTYIQRVAPKNPSKREKWALAELAKIKTVFEECNFPKKPCHNDIQSNNLFILDDKVSLIDWGDAGMGDPFWDLARTSMEFFFDSKQNSYFLGQYLGNVTARDKSRFHLMRQVFMLRTAFMIRTLPGSPSKEELKRFAKVFECNKYPLTISKGKKVTWMDLYSHTVKLFLKNSKTAKYRESLNVLKRGDSDDQHP